MSLREQPRLRTPPENCKRGRRSDTPAHKLPLNPSDSGHLQRRYPVDRNKTHHADHDQSPNSTAKGQFLDSCVGSVAKPCDASVAEATLPPAADTEGREFWL